MSTNNQLENMGELEDRNVIVWLDFNGYAYVNFAIILALSKLNKFNLIGIVASKSDLIFFQTQKIITFKKLIYFPECYDNKSSYNIENLKSFEKKYELNLWLDVFSERYFYRFWNDFHKFTKDEILTILDNVLLFFDDVLQKYNPSLIFMQHAGENISNLLLYQIAKKMGIKVLMPSLETYMQNKIFLATDLENSEISNEFKKLMLNFNNLSQLYDEKFIKNQNTGILNTVFDYGYNLNLTQKFHHYTKRFFTNPESIYQNSGKTKINMIKHRWKTRFKIKEIEKFLESNSIKSIEDKKFLYFPLASEPEARILAQSPFYSNQIALIENIAKAIPIDYVLYVKEHPLQKIKLWRSIDDYKKILSLPNVKLVDINLNNQNLISKSQGIISISGGTGFEALFNKKPIILFSHAPYDVLSMVTKIKSFSSLPEDISRALNDFKFNNKELNAYMHVFTEKSLSVPYHSMLKDGNTLSSLQVYENNLNLTLKNFNTFYETYQHYFELIARIVYSKL